MCVYVDADQTPSPGSNNNGLPAASGSSVNVTDNNSDTAHTNQQIALSNSMTASNIATQPTAQDSSDVAMPNNNNITSTNSPATFSNSVTLTDNPSLVSGGFVAATNTNQGPFPAVAQETCNQSNEVYQCNGPPQLISSSETNTVSSAIQPFHHDEAKEQIQQEVEVSYNNDHVWYLLYSKLKMTHILRYVISIVGPYIVYIRLFHAIIFS